MILFLFFFAHSLLVQGVVSELQDVFRRRAEIEASYSRELDKLAKYITNRNKEQKQRSVMRYLVHLF